MTGENYNYRTSQALLRNQFPGKGKLKIPIIPKFEAKPGDFDDLLLIGFDKTHLEDNNHLDRMVHFFLYDYRFERVWKNPDNDIEKLSRYRAVLSPDFSMYLEMAPVMQIYNVFRNRWCGAYWASKGIRVIPSVNWGDESTFDFCFQGIEKGSTVAVSTYMASESEHHKEQKEWFMVGYNEMLRQIEPEQIICYNTPFPEMEGNIVYVDYDRSSWRYMNYERSLPKEDLDCYKIGGAIQPKYDIMEAYRIGKGGGSAYGGDWKPSPNKPQDQRFLGEPGQTNQSGNKKTHIGNDGKADYERHETDHGNSKAHTNPHDHKVDWGNGFPDLGDPINYPDGAPPFEDVYGGYLKMYHRIIPENTPEQNRFTSISDFKWCMKCGGEVQFIWNGTTYCCFGKLTPKGSSTPRMLIAQSGSVETNQRTEKWCDDSDEVLDYRVGSARLRDVITQVTVIERTI